jgi:hypothetical protein
MKLRRLEGRTLSAAGNGLTMLRHRVVGVAKRRSPGADEFWTAITRLPNRSLVAVHGVVDAGTSACFQEAIKDSLDFSPLPVTLDLTDAEFVDAEAVKFLADAWHRAVSRGIKVELMVNVQFNAPLGRG